MDRDDKIDISIIIPFYYGNEFINSLLRRIKENRLLMNEDIKMETIIVNDSPECIVSLMENYHELSLKIINNMKNEGIHKSRVNGLAYAKGVYILFLDQDDMIGINYIQSQYTNIKGNDFIICDGYIEHRMIEKKYTIFRSRIVGYFVGRLLTYICASNPIISPGQALIKKKSIPDEWKKYILMSNGSDDLFLWILLFSKGAKYKYNPSCLYTHKNTGDNFSNDNVKMLQSDCEVYEILKEHNLLSRYLLNLMKCNLIYKNMKQGRSDVFKVYKINPIVFLYRFVYRFFRGLGKVVYLINKRLR